MWYWIVQRSGSGPEALLQVPGPRYVDEASLLEPGFCQAAGWLGGWMLSLSLGPGPQAEDTHERWQKQWAGGPECWIRHICRHLVSSPDAPDRRGPRRCCDLLKSSPTQRQPQLIYFSSLSHSGLTDQLGTAWQGTFLILRHHVRYLSKRIVHWYSGVPWR